MTLILSDWLTNSLNSLPMDLTSGRLIDWLRLTEWSTDSLIDWLTNSDWLNDRLTHWLTDWLTQTDSLINWLRLTDWWTDSLNNLPMYLTRGRLSDWLKYCVIQTEWVHDWLPNSLSSPPRDLLTGWLFDWLNDWLTEWMTDSLWLSDWIALSWTDFLTNA